MRIAKMPRVILALAKNNDYKIVKFPECIVEYFQKDADSVTVDYRLEDKILVLTQAEKGVQLKHSTMCPIKLLKDLGNSYPLSDGIREDKIGLNIPVAVSIIVESSDKHILLTRRAAHMRSSPRVWVPPGGHLELNETLLEGGIREVKEETGLDITEGTTNILCMWENVFPLLLGLGPPTNHVLTIYFHALLSQTHEELTAQMTPDPQEVEAFAWLSNEALTEMFTTAKPTVTATQYILENGKFTPQDLTYPHQMFNRKLWASGKSYSGVQYALKMWLSLHPTKNLSSKF